MKLIIVNGFAGSGKDEFVKKVQEFALEDPKMIVHNIHSSDRAKAALKLLNWSGAKSTPIRRLLADLCDFGQERRVSETMIDEARQSGADVVFFHERNPEQIELLLRRYGDTHMVRTLMVVRDAELRQAEPEEDIWGIEDYDYDLYVYNNGTLEELHTMAKRMANYLKEGNYGN